MLNFLNIREHSPEYYWDKPQWAYYYCKDIKDIKAVREYITSSEYAYKYCRYIKDTKEVRKHITDSYWASCYRGWKKKQC